jgi:glutamate dehydrogenase (NADP+)
MTDDEMFALDCDVLVPAAMEDQIHERNVNGITATVILEPANGPVTAGADKVLNKKGITVLPDILANAGGVSVSYYEWVQNRQGFSWTAEEVQARLKPLMESESMAVWRVAQTKKIPMRTAAYVRALGRLSDAIRAHGTQAYFCPSVEFAAGHL